jgi:hypothetical protein
MRRLHRPVADRQKGLPAKVLRLVLRFLEKWRISRGFRGFCLDSKSGAASAVEGSTPLPSAQNPLRDNELRKGFFFDCTPPISSSFRRATRVLRDAKKRTRNERPPAQPGASRFYLFKTGSGRTSAADRPRAILGSM